LKLGFKSKKNKVVFSNGLIEKHMNSSDVAIIEAEKLKLLHNAGVRVPEVISQEKNILRLKYVDGITITDLIEAMENNTFNQLECLINSLVSWLNDFYNAVGFNNANGKTGEIRGDVNFRNFIFDGTHCWGIDFEEQIFGEKEQDIGRMIAFILSYHPPNTYIKNLFAQKLLDKAIVTFALDQAKIFRWRDDELKAIALRRTK